MDTVNATKSELESWLKILLQNEELIDLTIEIEGGTEKGEGYVGDIIFVTVNGTTKTNANKIYNLVIKCGKRSKDFRVKFPVLFAFLNEIHFYKQIQPTFVQFQKDKGVDDLFDKVPRCFGTLTTDGLEVIALENLRKKGYHVWDRKKPLTRRHINMIIEEYGRFHAISVAMQDQKPEKFRQLASNLNDFLGELYRVTDLLNTHEDLIDEIYDLLKGDLPDDVLLKWKKLKDKVRPFFAKVIQHLDGINVIVHGDCWCSNFMHYSVDNEPIKFAILDWQLVKVSTPILDISYFLFACISEEDINDIDIILKNYYKSFSNHLQKLGTDSSKLYPFDQLLQDWKKYAKFGIFINNLINKFALTEKEEVPDMVKAAEEGDVTKSFSVTIKDSTGFKKRLRYVVKYVGEHNLI